MEEKQMEQEQKDTSINYEEEFKKLQAEAAKLKSSFDKAASEVAEYKRKEAARMTDEEKKQAELQEKEKEWQAIKKENAFYKYSQKLSETIKDKKILDEVATAYANGDTETAIEKQCAYFAQTQSELGKKIKAELLQNQPEAHPQNPNKGQKSWAEMTLDEKTKLKRDNPQLYNQLKK